MSAEQITVAVTGPTGDIGRPLMRALERAREIGRIRAMARRAVDPAQEGWRRTEYVRGDVLDRQAVDQLVADADAVVHLVWLPAPASGRRPDHVGRPPGALDRIGQGPEESRRVNLEGSRTVFEAAVAAGVKRLVHVSSVAAYGFHADNPQPLTEDVETRGTEGFYYSAHKAEVERVLREVAAGVDAYVMRPCIVAGPESLGLIRSLPYVQLSSVLPQDVRHFLSALPVGPVLPDFGIPFQLVHADDLALALRAAALGRGEPGPYNIAGQGELTVHELAGALGWRAMPVPPQTIEALADLMVRMPLAPARASWLEVFRHPVIMDTAKARAKLRWRPRHDARSTLGETVEAARKAGLLGSPA